MTTTLITLGLGYLVGLLVLAAAVLRAPEGYEDKEGFHSGRRRDA